jgi:hypothetical protein
MEINEEIRELLKINKIDINFGIIEIIKCNNYWENYLFESINEAIAEIECLDILVGNIILNEITAKHLLEINSKINRKYCQILNHGEVHGTMIKSSDFKLYNIIVNKNESVPNRTILILPKYSIYKKCMLLHFLTEAESNIKDILE